MEHWKRLPRPTESLPLIESWFRSPAGLRLLEAEQDLLTPQLSTVFGYHLLQLSVSRDVCLFQESRIQHKFRCHPLSDDSGRQQLCSAFDQLPFAENSLDLVILHHVQEFVANPHQVLRELQRVLIPQGQVILLGFNPWSLLGLHGRLAGLRSNTVWHNHFLSTRRIVDWLNLLGFQVELIRYTFHRPPIAQTAVFDRLSINRSHWWTMWPLGGVYMIRAVSQVSAMTPRKLRWSDKKRAFPKLVTVKPSAGSIQHRQQDHE